MYPSDTILGMAHLKGSFARHLRRFLLAVAAAWLAGSSQAATQVAIVQGRWQLNGKVTYPGTPAEGLLMNVRMVNATFEDRNRPDFNADANTNEFIARIPEYAAYGVRAFTLCLQGGMPGYEGALNSAFQPDGSLREEYLRRVRRVIEACDRNGVAIILGCYYQRQSKVLRDEAAVRAGVVHVARWIQFSGFENVLLEVANEYAHRGFVHSILRDPKGEVELIRLAKQTAPGLLVSTSGVGDGKLHKEVAEASDFILIHFNGLKLRDIPPLIEALKGFHKPIVCNEDDRPVADFPAVVTAAVANGASYGLMLEGLNQEFPFAFNGPADAPEVYAVYRKLTSAAKASRPTLDTNRARAAN